MEKCKNVLEKCNFLGKKSKVKFYVKLYVFWVAEQENKHKNSLMRVIGNLGQILKITHVSLSLVTSSTYPEEVMNR